MPIYEYACVTCGNEFDQLRQMKQVNEDVLCVVCDGRAIRRLSLFSSIMKDADSGSDGLTRDGGCACGGSCNCGA